MAWKSLPSKTDSKLDTAVRLKMNSQDAMKPPRMVADWVEDKRGLYICNRENRSTEMTLDKTRETEDETAERDTGPLFA